MNTVQGTVTLQISELDQLRKSLSDVIIERDHLRETEKQIKVSYRVVENTFQLENRRNYGYKSWETSLWNEREFTTHMVQKERTILESIEFKNLEELKDAFKTEAKHEVFKQIDNLNSEISTLNQINSQLKKTQQEKVDELYNGYKEEIKKQKESYEIIIKELEDKISVLEGNEVEKTKDKRLKELEEEFQKFELKVKKLESSLQKEKSKSWWTKLRERPDPLWEE